jgi:hypothetical protein
MKSSTKKAILIMLPLVVGGSLIYAMNHKPKKVGRPIDATDPDQKLTDVDTTKPTATKVQPEFPLKKGSTGEKVKELQAAIGLTGKDVDGDFGSGTEAKLLSFAGIKEVTDQAQLDEVKRKSIGISNKLRADTLVARFKKGGVAMMCTANVSAQVVTQDSFGAITYLKKYLSLSAGKVYNSDDYKMVGSTQLGNLLFQVTRGTLAGLYAVDPNKVTVANI